MTANKMTATNMAADSENSIEITDIQRFCMHDGPGIRTTIFFKGCPLHCKWCHNPETQSGLPQILFTKERCLNCGACAGVCENNAQIRGNLISFDRNLCKSCGKCANVCPSEALELSGYTIKTANIIDIVKKDVPFFSDKGGITLSGGEPTMQIEPLLKLMSCAKSEGISVCIETCGAFNSSFVGELVPLTDLVLFDIKDTDAERLKENTGASYTQIINNLRLIDSLGGKTVLRALLIPDINIESSHASKLAELYNSMKNCEYIELLPYHPYGTSKAIRLDISQPVYCIPSREDILSFAKLLREKNVMVKCFGSILP